MLKLNLKMLKLNLKIEKLPYIGNFTPVWKFYSEIQWNIGKKLKVITKIQKNCEYVKGKTLKLNFKMEKLNFIIEKLNLKMLKLKNPRKSSCGLAWIDALKKALKKD